MTPVYVKWCKTSPLDGWKLSGWCITMVSHCRTPTLALSHNSLLLKCKYACRKINSCHAPTGPLQWLTGNVTMRVGKTSVLYGVIPAAQARDTAYFFLKCIYSFVGWQYWLTQHKPRWWPWDQQVDRFRLRPACNKKKKVWRVSKQHALITALHTVALNTTETAKHQP